MTTRGIRAQVLMVLAALILHGALNGAAAFAQQFGRVTVDVVDDDGNPIEGVAVTVTSKELSRFSEEKATNKKGKATFSFVDATKEYEFHFEHGAYPPVDKTIKPQLGQSITREVVLSTGQAAPPSPGTEGGTMVFTPAERVFNEGVEALRAGDQETAKANFLEAIEKDDKLVLAHSAIAGIYLEEKNYPSAIASAQRLLELDAENPRGYRILYEAYRATGEQDKAEEALKTLGKLDRGGDSAKIAYNEGVAASKVGDYEEAKQRFEEAIQLDPNLTPAAAALAIVYIREDNYQAAAEMAEKHLAVDPQNPQSLQIRYEAYKGLGNEAKAEEALKALAAVNPQSVITGIMQKGVELFEQGNVEAAKVEFEKVLGLDPNHARAHYRLGVTLVSAGEMGLAKQHLNKFLELAPDDPEAATANDMLKYIQ